MLTESIVKSLSFRVAGATALAVVFAVSPALAQFQMPDPKEMSGLPRPDGQLPNGIVSVRLIRGQLSNNIVDFPVELHGGEKVLTVNTDDTGRAQFGGVRPGTRVHAVATVDGERLESREFPVPETGGVRVMLVATANEGVRGSGPATAPRAEAAPGGGAAPGAPAQPGMVVLGGNTRFVVEMSDAGPQVFYLFDIQNTARAPVNPSKPFVVDLPSDATNATLMDGSSPQALLKDNRLTVNGPFAPGRTVAQVAFLVGSGSSVRLSPTLPAPLEQLAVVVHKIGDVTVNSRQLTTQQDMPAEGQTYILASGPPVAAGTPISIDIDGMPSHSPVPRYVALALTILIVAIGVWGAAAPKQASAVTARRQQLQARREKLFNDLVRLEQQRRDGQVAHDQYVHRRQTLVAQLERVYGELDQRGSVRGNEGLAA